MLTNFNSFRLLPSTKPLLTAKKATSFSEILRLFIENEAGHVHFSFRNGNCLKFIMENGLCMETVMNVLYRTMTGMVSEK